MSEGNKIPTMAELAAAGTTPEILFWVGCAGSFDDRAKRITKAFVRLLQKAKVSFAVLGTEESCTGDPAKRAGNEFLFQMQAAMNIEVLNGYETVTYWPPPNLCTYTVNFLMSVSLNCCWKAGISAASESPTTTPVTWAGPTAFTKPRAS